MFDQIVVFHFIPYLILVLICGFLSYFKTKDNLGFIGITLCLIVFSAVRYNVGWDYPAYVELIEGRMSLAQFNRIEWLSRYLMLLSRYTFTQLYFIINTIVGILCLYSVVDKYSEDKSLSMFLFLTFSLFYLMTMNIIRNFTAILIVMYACKLMLDKRYLYFIAIIFIAAGIHSSAYVGLLLPIIYILLMKYNIGLRFNVFCFIISLFISNVLLTILSSMSSNPLLSAVIYYIENNSSGSGNIYKYILYLFDIIFFVLWKKMVAQNQLNKYWITLFNVGVCFWNAFSFQYTLSIRMALYFIVWLIIIIPSLEFSFSDMYRKLIRQIVMLFFIGLFFFNLYILARAYNLGDLAQASFLPYKIFIFN